MCLEDYINIHLTELRITYVKKPTKYIFVTGGVVSSLGKGLTSAALGALLEQRGPLYVYKNSTLI